jgi:hypothetical protein
MMVYAKDLERRVKVLSHARSVAVTPAGLFAPKSENKVDIISISKHC